MGDVVLTGDHLDAPPDIDVRARIEFGHTAVDPHVLDDVEHIEAEIAPVLPKSLEAPFEVAEQDMSCFMIEIASNQRPGGFG